MNSDFPQNDREKLEAKLTAFILGELSPDEIVVLCKAMDEDPKLAALYERLKLTIGLVRESAANPAAETTAQSAPLKLSEARRQKLLAHFKTITPKEFAKPRRRPDWLVPLAATAVIVIFFGWMALPNLSKTRGTSAKNSVINNLRLLDGAKQQWALENNKPEDATPTLKDLEPYIGRGEPVGISSVAGETYVPGKVSELPKVETSVSEAKRLFGRRAVANAEIHNGKVQVSPYPEPEIDGATTQLASGNRQQKPGQTGGETSPMFGLAPAAPSVSVFFGGVSTGDNLGPAPVTLSATVAPPVSSEMVFPPLAAREPTPKTEIVLPSSSPSNNFAGNPDWIGVLEPSTPSRSSDNKFISRYASVVPQGENLATNSFYSLSQMWAADVSGVTNFADNSDSYNPQKSYRMLSQLGVEPGGDQLNLNYTDRIAGTAGKFETRALDRVTNSIASAEWDGHVSLLGDIPYIGSLPRSEPKLAAAANPEGKFSGGSTQLETRTFKIDPNTFYAGLQNAGAMDLAGKAGGGPTSGRVTGSGGVTNSATSGLRYVTGLDPTAEIQTATTSFLHAAGVDLNGSKSVFFNDRQGTLTVRGTGEDLKNVEAAIETLKVAPPNVVLNARFADVSSNENRALALNWYAGNVLATNGMVAASGTVPGNQPQAAAPRATDRVRSLKGENVQTSQLIQDGKLMFQLGKLDEADAKIKEALKRDPSNQAALYYESLTKQARDRQIVEARNATSMERMVQVKKDGSESASAPSLAMTHGGLWDSANLRVQLEAEYNRQEKLLQQLKSLDKDSLKKSLPVAVSDNQLNTLLSERDLAEQNLIKLKTDYAPNDPKYRRAKELADDLDRKVDDHVAGIMTGLETKVASSKAYLDALTTNIEAAQRSDIETTKKIDPYFAAKEQLEDAKRWQQVLAMRTGQEEVEKGLPRASMVTIVDLASAAPAQKPSFGEKIKETFTGKVERTTRIRVEQEHPDLGGVGGGPSVAGYDPYFLQNEFQTIQSHAVLSNVVASLKLNEEWGKKFNRGQPLSEAKAEELIKRNLDLHPVPNTKLIEIGVKNESPVEAARIANAVAAAYRQYRADDYEELKSHGIKSLQQQLGDQDKKVQLAQAKVDELAKKLNVFDAATGAPIAPALQRDTALPKPSVPPPTPQPEILTRENAFSTFSLNVSDVSFKLAAASLEKGQMPEPASIRSEEFINAFDYRDPDAAPGVPIAFASERARYPFAQNRELLRFSLKTAAAGRQAGRPLNIVLLLDNSGSMERADRVRIIQEALRVLASQLQPQDTFSLVTFARTAQLRVDGIPGNQAAAVIEEIAKLTPEGGTNLGDALDVAYETALHHYLAKGDNRVVVLTDGAANLGDVNPDALKQKVEAHRKQGVALDCFGIGWEGYNDDLLETLTRNGDGRYGFINTPEEANTEFVAQIAGALHVAASDVKVQVEFNPRRVTSYRQIGYAKHQLTKEQFRDNTVDAAEIAAQEAGNALYAIETNPQGEGSIATVHVRYKVPGTSDYREQAWDVPYTGNALSIEQASPALRLATTASAFSEWLATSPFATEVTTDRLLNCLNGVPQVYGADARPKKLESMIRQARSISGE